MAEPEQVVEAIQSDAVAETVAMTVAGDSMIAAEVADVGDALADHAEVSEERHEEILEGEGWLGQRVSDVIQRLDTLSTSMAAQQQQASASQQAMLANLSALQTILESRLPSQVSMQSIPEPSSETVIAVVEPEASAEEESQKDRKTEPPPRRKRRII